MADGGKWIKGVKDGCLDRKYTMAWVQRRKAGCESIGPETGVINVATGSPAAADSVLRQAAPHYEILARFVVRHPE